MRPFLQVILNELRRYARKLHVNGSEYGCPVRVAKVGASFTL